MSHCRSRVTKIDDFDLGNMQNTKPEKSSMTAPVIPKSSHGSENIAKTAPVVMRSDEIRVTMQFVLPAKYQKAAGGWKGGDKKGGKSKYGVVKFGVTYSKWWKVDNLMKSLEKDACKVIGEFLLARYNPPWTLPVFRTNEI